MNKIILAFLCYLNGEDFCEFHVKIPPSDRKKMIRREEIALKGFTALLDIAT